MEKLVKKLALAAVGWFLGEIATEHPEAAGIPKQTATVVGGFIGGLI